MAVLGFRVSVSGFGFRFQVSVSDFGFGSRVPSFLYRRELSMALAVSRGETAGNFPAVPAASARTLSAHSGGLVYFKNKGSSVNLKNKGS